MKRLDNRQLKISIYNENLIMKNNQTLALVIICFFTIFYNSISAQSTSNLISINQTWTKFCTAFATLDHELMAEIHSTDLIRISGGKKISDYGSYISGFEQTFENAKDEGYSNHISLRFFERINNDSIASERGIYQLVRNQGKSHEKSYYGQFHVILKKIDDEWKIIVDYDSNEEGAIGEKQFLASRAMSDVDSFK